MNMDEGRFWKWRETATAGELHLFEKVCELAELFGDMRFQEDTHSGALMKVQRQDPQSGQWIDDRMPIPDLLEYFSETFFTFKVFAPEDLEDKDTLGYFDPEDQVLAVRTDQLDSDSTILHELIHVHELALGDETVPLYFRDMLFWSLYQQVRKRIPQLDKMISDHAMFLNQKVLNDRGGKHDILFLLKSFDLDMRKGYPLGTVFGYGRVGEFKGYSYEPYEGE